MNYRKVSAPRPFLLSGIEGQRVKRVFGIFVSRHVEVLVVSLERARPDSDLIGAKTPELASASQLQCQHAPVSPEVDRIVCDEQARHSELLFRAKLPLDLPIGCNDRIKRCAI